MDLVQSAPVSIYKATGSLYIDMYIYMLVWFFMSGFS